MFKSLIKQIECELCRKQFLALILHDSNVHFLSLNVSVKYFFFLSRLYAIQQLKLNDMFQVFDYIVTVAS